MAKALQDMGFTLDEVIDALHTHDAGGTTCDSERWRLEAVVDRIDTKIADLQRARRHTKEILDGCLAGQCQFVIPDDPVVVDQGSGAAFQASEPSPQRNT